MMIKFPSIEQYRTVIRHVQNKTRYVGKDENGDPVYDHTKPMPTLKYRGTVKLHGTNAGIVYDVATDSLSFQSRERVLTLTSDNAGFMLHMMKYEQELLTGFRDMVFTDNLRMKEAGLADILTPIKTVAIFGEWCGGSIQKGVALNGLDKMFVVFATKFIFEDETTEWVPLEGDEIPGSDVPGMYYIDQFPTFEMEIDFANPEIAQNKMIEITEEVEKECPVGKHFGVSGIGEGVVWTCVSPGWDDSGTWFKVKGEKHANSKVRTLAPVDVEAIQNLKAFVDSVVTENRLEQGLDNLVREQLKPFEMASLGDFIRWVFNDVMKEEMDTIVANGFDPKKLGGPIANAARPWFIKRFNESVGV